MQADDLQEGQGRQPNFSKSDEILLMSEVQKRQAILFGSFSGPGLCNKKKQQSWEEVVRAFNSQSSSAQVRTVKQLKKKYNNLKSEAKSKLSKRKHPPTGGGPPDTDLSMAQQMFLDMAGDAPNILGVPGGGMESLSDVEALLQAAVCIPDSDSLGLLDPVPGLASTPAVQTPDKQQTSNRPVSTIPAWSTPAITPLPSTPALSTTPAEANLPVSITEKETEVTGTTQPGLFPPPGATRSRNPRSDKVESDLRIEVLRLEKEKVQAVLDYINLKKQQAIEKHEAKMDYLRRKRLCLD